MFRSRLSRPSKAPSSNNAEVYIQRYKYRRFQACTSMCSIGYFRSRSTTCLLENPTLRVTSTRNDVRCPQFRVKKHLFFLRNVMKTRFPERSETALHGAKLKLPCLTTRKNTTALSQFHILLTTRLQKRGTNISRTRFMESQCLVIKLNSQQNSHAGKVRSRGFSEKWLESGKICRLLPLRRVCRIPWNSSE